MTNPFKDYTPFEHQDRNKSPVQEAKEVLGFIPDLLVNLTGTTFRDPNGILRQDHLANAREVFRKYNGMEIELLREQDNRYDEYALAVLMPTADSPSGEMKDWRHVGYIPRKVCWDCFTSLSGKKASSLICPECGAAVDQEKHILNQHLTRLLNLGKGGSVTSKVNDIPFGLVWISAGEGKFLGARLGFKLGEAS